MFKTEGGVEEGTSACSAGRQEPQLSQRDEKSTPWPCGLGLLRPDSLVASQMSEKSHLNYFRTK